MNIWRNTRTLKAALRQRLQDRLTHNIWMEAWQSIQMKIWPITFSSRGQVGAVKRAIARKGDA